MTPTQDPTDIHRTPNTFEWTHPQLSDVPKKITQALVSLSLDPGYVSWF